MSAWQCDRRREERNYTDPNDNKAFNAGYSDGYYGYPQFTSQERNWYPQPYSAGYWEGVADKEHEENQA